MGDVPANTSESDLQGLFSQAGDVASVTLMDNADSGAHRFAFVQMADSQGAHEAVQRFNGYSLNGSRLIVYAVPPQSRPRNHSG